MSNLYGEKLAAVYDKMYQGFIDYNEEYLFYSSFCKTKKANTILELACGSGNLASKFDTEFQEYLGLDYSEHMLSLAREKNPQINFVQGDMTNFDLTKKYDIALITGRSTSYLLTDKDCLNAFKSIYNAIVPKGHLVFDFIEAYRFITAIEKNPSVIHESVVDDIPYSRASKWHLKEKEHNIIDWSGDYYKSAAGESIFLGNDTATFRVFTESEIVNFLNSSGFKILNIQYRTTYAFETFVVFAQKE